MQQFHKIWWRDIKKLHLIHNNCAWHFKNHCAKRNSFIVMCIFFVTISRQIEHIVLHIIRASGSFHMDFMTVKIYMMYFLLQNIWWCFLRTLSNSILPCSLYETTQMNKPSIKFDSGLKINILKIFYNKIFDSLKFEQYLKNNVATITFFSPW